MNNWLDTLEGWENAKPEKREAKTVVPDGITRALITGVEIMDEKPQIKFKLKFLEYNDAPRTKVMFFTGEYKYTRQELAAIGLDSDDTTEMIQKIRNSPGMVILVNVKTKAGAKYSDMYFNKDTGERMEVEVVNDFPGADILAMDGWS